MEHQEMQKESHTLKPAIQEESQDHFVLIPTLLALLDLLDVRHLIIEALLHPLEAIKAYTPQLNMGGRTFSPATDIPDLSGKVILVTGGRLFSRLLAQFILTQDSGNTGLGLESVRQLAAHNPSRIYLASRTPSKGEAAVEGIKKAVPSADIVFLPLDLASFDSISAAAKDLTSKSQRLDILLNNAGVMALPNGKTKDGYEIQFGTNHIGHALLTRLLLPTLLETAKQPGADVRIINLTSEAHNFARSANVLCDQRKLEAQGAWTRYGLSKLANILFTHELAKRYPSITSVSVHPGIIKSDLWAPNAQSNTFMKYIMMAPLVLTGQSIQEGAKNQLFAATGKKADLVNGTYYKPIGSASKGNGLAQDSKLATKLWEWTEKELDGKGY